MISLLASSRLQKRLLRFWEDADPDIPTLKEAKVEYTKLK